MPGRQAFLHFHITFRFLIYGKRYVFICRKILPWAGTGRDYDYVSSRFLTKQTYCHFTQDPGMAQVKANKGNLLDGDFPLSAPDSLETTLQSISKQKNRV